jgi:exodeoxyribonuclease V alpha subunit
MSITLEQLDTKQREAVERGCDMKQRCVPVTGAAGSGKTTIIKMITEAVTGAGYSCALAAPTGKAAKRVKEATGIHAKTIHKLLEYGMPKLDEVTGKPITTSEPRRDHKLPLEEDVLIIDEYPMVNRELHANLIQAMKPGSRIIVVGDGNQLPPIETLPRYQQEPSAFSTMFEKFKGITLDKVHRVAEGSGILFNSQRILKGIPPQNNAETKLVVTDQAVNKVIEACETADYTQLNNQVITPGNKSWIGTVKLNAKLQLVLMPDVERITITRHKWDKNTLMLGVGDKVIMTKNWYGLECSDMTLGVYNGEIGIVTDIDDLGVITVNFGDRYCAIPPLVEMLINNTLVVANPQKDLQLAYAITTHKMQGSECDNVIYVMDKAVFGNLCRPNFYTGFTRARKHVTVVTDQRALQVSLLQKSVRQFTRRPEDD